MFRFYFISSKIVANDSTLQTMTHNYRGASCDLGASGRASGVPAFTARVCRKQMNVERQYSAAAAAVCPGVNDLAIRILILIAAAVGHENFLFFNYLFFRIFTRMASAYKYDKDLGFSN